MGKRSERAAVRRGIAIADGPQTDRARWQAALAPGDVLEEGGSRGRYSAASNRKNADCYGLWLAWLRQRGMLNVVDAPADRITAEHVRAYVAELSAVVAPNTVLTHLRALYQMAVVMDACRDWRWIREATMRIRMYAEPVRRKRDRMVSSHELLCLGQRLMAGAATQPAPRLSARAYRNGLIIALLAARPLRRRNLAGLGIDRTLVRRGSAWWIDISANETKTREPIEAPWPEALTAALEVYLNEHRPVLSKRVGRWARPVGNALWVSSDGSPMRPRALYEMIVARTAEAYGKPVNPHLFRDCAATSIAIEDPEHVHRLADPRAPIDGHDRALLQPGAGDRCRSALSVLPCRASRRHHGRRPGTRRRAPDARRHLCPLLDRSAERSLHGDQVRLCRTRIEAEAWSLVATYTDHAHTGASRLRPGYQKLLEDAPAGTFDIVVAEALDRLSRDQEDTAALYKQLGFAGVRLLILAEGEISELHVGLKGTMNALFLKDLAMKTRRGLEGRIRQGRSGGGLCYGYKVAAERDSASNPIPGGREIDVGEAEIVVRIFREYAAGRSPRAIARRLNADGIPGPGGRPWGDTSIRGHALRGTGLLHNELYVGRLVWNRQRYMKDPKTGRRVARLNPESAWIIQEVPSCASSTTNSGRRCRRD